MTAPSDALEERLLQAYREQLRRYDQALALVSQESAPSEIGTGHWASELDAILQSIAALDAPRAEDKEFWRECKRVPGVQLAALLDQIAGRLAMLGQIVKGQEAEFAARKARLLPEMDAFIQQRRMLSAYGSHGDRHPHVAKAN